MSRTAMLLCQACSKTLAGRRSPLSSTGSPRARPCSTSGVVRCLHGCWHAGKQRESSFLPRIGRGASDSSNRLSGRPDTAPSAWDRLMHVLSVHLICSPAARSSRVVTGLRVPQDASTGLLLRMHASDHKWCETAAVLMTSQGHEVDAMQGCKGHYKVNRNQRSVTCTAQRAGQCCTAYGWRRWFTR